MIDRKVFCVTFLAMFAQLPLATADVKLNGYFSQALVHSPDNPFFETGQETSFNYRELGINGNWQVSERVRLAAQIVSRRLGDIDDGSPKLDFGLLDLQLYRSEAINAGLRLGRTKNAYGIYNKTRDVPHARPGVLVPHAIYFESMRDALLSVDGGNVYFDAHLAIGDIAFEAYVGKRKLDDSIVENLMYQADSSGDFGEADVVGGRIGFAPTAIPDLSLAFSLIDVEMQLEGAQQYTPQQAALAGADLFFNPAIAGKYATSSTVEPLLNMASVQYGLADWVFTAEYLQAKIELTDLSILHVPRPDNETTLEGYYVQAEWAGSDSFSIFARYQDLVYDKNDRKGEAYAANTGRNAQVYYDSALTLGSRWYFTPDFSATAEYSRHEGAASLVGPNSIDYAALVKDWDLFVVQFSYHF